MVRRQNKLRERVRRRHIRRRQRRLRCRPNILWRRRRHHVAVGDAIREHLVRLLALGASPRVGVAVYPRVPRELVRARELLAASREVASVRLLASVRPDVPRLVLQTVEGLVTERALVGAWKLVVHLGGLASGQRPVWPEDRDRGHVAGGLVGLLRG